MQVTLEYAQEHFADLVSAVNRGEEVEIAQPQLPALKLTGLKVTNPVLVNGKRVLGAGRGELRVPSDEEWAQMKRETADLMNNGPILPE